jgi:8-oxo-dGTP pyrophosphatase MutT (NUDIX family)
MIIHLIIHIEQIRSLHLVEKPQVIEDPAQEARHLKAAYQGNPAVLRHYTQVLEQSDCPYNQISIIGKPEKMLEDLQSLYKLQPAAGGVIRNLEGNILLIFRRGSWDLPKGKIDDGELSEQAALREVAEEVGLENCEIIRPLTITYHTFYDRKGRNILKPTYWYLMETPDDVVTLQTEEDIEASVWTNPTEFLKKKEPIYPNIVRVLQML